MVVRLRSRVPFWVLLVLYAVALSLPSFSQASDCNVTISSACLARLSLQSETTPLLTSFKNVSEAVLRCVGYQGVALRPLRLIFPAQATGVFDTVIPMFKNMTGFEVTVDFSPVEEIGDRVLEATTLYDGWISDSRWVVDMARQGMLEPLTNYIAAAPALDWLDVERFFRTTSSVYNGSVIGVPVAGKVATLYYRADVFAAAKLQVPNTWQELLQVAKTLNGTDFGVGLLADGVGDYSLCLQIKQPCVEREVLVGQLLSSMTQTQGTASGWLFNIETMQPNVDSPAFSVTLDLIREFLSYTKPHATCEYVEQSFIRGQCAMIIKWEEQFKAIETFDQVLKLPFNPWKGKIGFAQVPGSAIVLDRSSGQLVNCTKTLCPFATWETARDGSQALVNRAPYGGMSGISGYVNSNSPPDYRKAAFDFFSILSDFKLSYPAIMAKSPAGPFRTRHLSTSNASLALWAAAGYSPADVTKFLVNIQTTLANPNMALDVRINGGQKYRAALDQAVGLLIEGATPSDAQAATVAKFAAITADMGIPISVIADGYYQGLNILRRWVAPVLPPPPSSPPPPPAPPLPPVVSGVDGGGGGMSLKTTLAVVFGGIVPGLIGVVLLIIYLVRSGRFTMFGFKSTPGVGPDTTLLVTDIESSTLLWESLEQETMNLALELHHGLVRKLLHMRAHMGYESATEGDSFILAFHTPQTALAFAQALQAGLLHLDWPEELLASSMAQPVWVKANPGQRPDLSQKSGLFSAPSAWRLTTRISTLSDPSEAADEQQQVVLRSLSERKHAPLTAGMANQSQQAVAFLRTQWTECGAQLEGQGSTPAQLLHRGLRVRVGLHSGIQDTQDVVLNKTTGRTQYSGRPLSTAKAVGDCGHGGMVMLSEGCFERIPVHDLARFGMLVQMGDVLFLKDSDLEPMSVYQNVAPGMEARLPFLEPKLRSVQQLQIGALDAPVGQASIAFVNLVGANTLLAWDRDVAQRAIHLYQHRAVTLMQDIQILDPLGRTDVPSKGYVVELAGGLCLAAFHSPVPAIRWGLQLVSELMETDWEEDLLQHELCESVVIGDMSTGMHESQNELMDNISSVLHKRAPPTIARVLFRGPRLKIGIDTGPVHAALNPTTGRMAYRGRVMNRASRIAEKAGSGQVWCSEAAWLPCQSLPTNELGLESQSLGPFALKGVSGDVNLLQCTVSRKHQANSGRVSSVAMSMHNTHPSLSGKDIIHSVPHSATRLPRLSRAGEMSGLHPSGVAVGLGPSEVCLRRSHLGTSSFTSQLIAAGAKADSCPQTLAGCESSPGASGPLPPAREGVQPSSVLYPSSAASSPAAYCFPGTGAPSHIPHIFTPPTGDPTKGPPCTNSSASQVLPHVGLSQAVACDLGTDRDRGSQLRRFNRAPTLGDRTTPVMSSMSNHRAVAYMPQETPTAHRDLPTLTRPTHPDTQDPHKRNSGGARFSRAVREILQLKNKSSNPRPEGANPVGASSRHNSARLPQVPPGIAGMPDVGVRNGGWGLQSEALLRIGGRGLPSLNSLGGRSDVSVHNSGEGMAGVHEEDEGEVATFNGMQV